MTVYIVSGFARSGTSMMMQACIAGGIPGVYTVEKNLELKRRDHEALKYPEDFDGKVVKILWRRIMTIDSGQARVVFMRRHVDEIRDSFFRVNPVGHPLTQHPERFNDEMAKALAWLRSKTDLFPSVDELWYRDVLDNPMRAFQILKDSGWPIDVKKASAIPNAK